MRASRLLIVFVKAPRPGTVKTRLAQSLGPEAACHIYEILVSRLWRQIESLNPVELRFSPDDCEKEIRGWGRMGWTLAPQGPGDLGERLQRAFTAAFAAGFQRVSIIGSDSPELTAQDIEEAWGALDAYEVVLGPTNDGGYWLIALKRVVPQLLQDIPWSTESVFDKTLERAQAAGLRVHCLRKLTDIDTERDWKAYLRRNAFASIAVGE